MARYMNPYIEGNRYTGKLSGYEVELKYWELALNILK